MSAKCFYCDCQLVRYAHAEGVPMPDDGWTIDHVMPRIIAGALTKRQKKLNLVDACHKCNNAKGSRAPLSWLASPKISDAGAERLGQRLCQLGFPYSMVLRAKNERVHALANRERYERA